MVGEYGNIGRSVEPHAVDEGRTLTIEIRPSSPVSAHDVSQGQRLFKPFKLLHALFYFPRYKRRIRRQFCVLEPLVERLHESLQSVGRRPDFVVVHVG